MSVSRELLHTCASHLARSHASTDASYVQLTVRSIDRYVRYSRWKPTSLAEADVAESRLLSLCRYRFSHQPISANPTSVVMIRTSFILFHRGELSFLDANVQLRVRRWTQPRLDVVVCGRTVLERRNVKVGEGKQDTMHTITGGQESRPALVCLAGYGAGAGFYFRNVDSLARHFRVHLVDLLGTGMSGIHLPCIPYTESPRPQFLSKF